MDRSLVIKSALDKGFLFADFQTGKIYTTRSRNRFENGMARELPGSICNGYKVHTIYYEGIKKQCLSHQIVFIAANGLYDKDKYMIDHIDRNRLNNKLSNLRLVDAKDNRDNATEYSGKLSEEQRQYLLELYLQGNNTIRDLAEDFGVSKSRVHQILHEEKERLDPTALSFSKWRNESIKSGGNAVVPQLVYEIFKAIQAHEDAA
jgi:DNA-directed RNA polymerase specialized sigma subunit